MDISNLSSYYDTMSQATQNQNSISNLSDKDLSNATDEELMDVCKQFESYFMEQIMKNMQKTVDVFKSEEQSSASMTDYFGDFTLSKLSEQSTEQNSLGLAQTLYDQMKRNYNL